MDLADERQRARWRHDLGALFRDRKVIAGMLPLAAFNPWVALLRECGAQRPLIVATGRGAGPVPTDDEAEIVVVDLPRFESMTEELRRSDHLARHLPPEAAAAVAAYDPERAGVWLLPPFVRTAPIDGRDVLGGRPEAWFALEDKLLADEIWSAAGADHVAVRVVPVDRSALDLASGALDEGSGVVWAGDARDGFNGGGDFTRWVVSPQDRAAALEFFAPRCDRVRVMAFLEGVPCSIHGMVLPDGTAAFRPVELGILRGRGRRFVFGGQGTAWDPPDEDRARMRDLVRRTGEHLRHRAGYRGAFGVDGVLTRDGFRPTELNARAAGGLATLGAGLDTAAFTLLQLSLLADRGPLVTVHELEAWVLPAMDEHRVTKAVCMAERRVVETTESLRVVWDGAALRRAEEHESAATVLVGPSAVGTFAMLKDLALAPGERLGHLNAALMRFLDAELGTGFGPVEAAPDVRAVLGETVT